MDKANVHRGAAPAMTVREALATERLRTLALCEALHHDFDSIVEASTSSNADDEHDPEGATVAFERAQVVALLAQSRSRLDDIDRAVQRCERGGYGICEGCGEAIPAERLAARPAARTCLRCAV
jgi:RNA polymerase-binding transcription factor DksA